jgi:hypothetical protein
VASQLESLQIESSDRECQFLTEAGGGREGGSFCLPLMEKERMKTSVSNML